MQTVTSQTYADLYQSLTPWERTQVQPEIGGASSVDYMGESDGGVLIVVPEHLTTECGTIGMEASDCHMLIPGCIPLHHWL
jgi:hypothetical protein